MEKEQKSVEIFHLLFLRHLNDKLAKDLYAIKGGCNLRFFFKSIRYSEDLDVDVKTVAKETLRSKINKVLGSQDFQQAIYLQGMEIDGISEAKQTDTTQRWKLSLHNRDGKKISTKIEFSRRGVDEQVVYELVDPELISRYQLHPILANHYIREAAFCQKVDALLHRAETQARDIFDLYLLFNQGMKSAHLPQDLTSQVNIAIERVLSIDFSDYKAHVVAYLLDEYQDYYNSTSIWSDIQRKVIAGLEGTS